MLRSTPNSVLCALTLLLSSASAFRNTSPFFLVSSSNANPIQEASSSPVQFARAPTIDSAAAAWLEECPVQNYIFVRQGCVSTEEFDGSQASPSVRRWLEDAGEKRRWVVPQVLGEVDVAGLEKVVVRKCGGRRMEVDGDDGSITVEDAKTRVFSVGFTNLCREDEPEYRESHLVRNDMFLSTLVSKLPSRESYAIIYTTTPDPNGYQARPEMDSQALLDALELDDPFLSTVHMDLRRDLESHTQASQLNSSLPLFEKYMFFSPGVFMGFTVSLGLLMILYVGITAISSLDVSYFAFSKEMGPAAQRKQQQQ